jgi:2-polyprenyl-3-methyl-5-hydroxy-6-metoxy-1,4-benzoquinol methylase
MSLAYRILYAVGFTPWEQMARAPISEQISRLFAREEEERGPPYGEALDLGCGSGIWAVELARRGWDVTGVDSSRRRFAGRASARRMRTSSCDWSRAM